MNGLISESAVELEEFVEFGFAVDVLGLHALNSEVVGLAAVLPSPPDAPDS